MFKGYLTRCVISNYEVRSWEQCVVEGDFNTVSRKLLEMFGSNKYIVGPNGEIYREHEESDPNSDYVLLSFKEAPVLLKQGS